MSSGLLDDLKSLGHERYPEIWCSVLAALLRLARDRPDITIDLIFMQETQRAGTNAGEDQQSQCQMRNGGRGKGFEERRHLTPWQGRDIGRLMALLAEKGPRLFWGLDIDLFA